MTEGIRYDSFLADEPTPVPGAVEYTVRGKGDYGKFRCEEGARARAKVAEVVKARSRSASPEPGRSKTKFPTTRRFRQLRMVESTPSEDYLNAHCPDRAQFSDERAQVAPPPKRVEVSKAVETARKEKRANALKGAALTMMGVSAVALFTIGMLASNFFTRIPILGRLGGSIAAGSTAALLLGGTAFIYSRKLQLEADRDHKQYLEDETAKLEVQKPKRAKRYAWEAEHLGGGENRDGSFVIQTPSKRSSS